MCDGYEVVICECHYVWWLQGGYEVVICDYVSLCMMVMRLLSVSVIIYGGNEVVICVIMYDGYEVVICVIMCGGYEVVISECHYV